MSEDISQTPAQPSKDDKTAQPKKKRRWLRRTLIGGTILIILLIALVLLAPMLLSLGPARSFVVGRVNSNIKGKLTIADWSLGWTSGVHLQNLKLFDEQNRLVLELNELKAPVSLVSAAGGDIDLKDTEIRGLNLALVEIDENGKTNLEHVLGLDDSSKPKTSKEKKRDEEEPAELPNVHGKVAVTDFRATVVAVGVEKPLHVESSSFKLNIPSINDPIENEIKIAFRVGDATPGSINITGTVDAVENNKLLDPTKMKATQDVEVRSVDLAALEPLAKRFGQDVQVEGDLNGDLDIRATGIDDAIVDGGFAIKGLLVGGEPLQGDTFRTSKLDIPLKITRQVADGQTVLKVETARVEIDQGSIIVSATLPDSSIEQLIAFVPEELPVERETVSASSSASPGEIVLSVDMDVAAIANQLPNVAKLAENTKLDSGKLTHKTTVTIKADQTSVASNSQIVNVSATADGKKVSLEPIVVDVKGAAMPGNARDLRDLGLDVKSGFATVTGGGATLAKLTVNGGFDLAKLQQQFGDLVDLDSILRGLAPESATPKAPIVAGGEPKLRGTGQFSLKTDGDLNVANSTTDLNASFALRDVSITNVTDQPIQQPLLEGGLAGKIVRGPIENDPTDLDSIRDVIVTFNSGQSAAPTIAMRAVAHIDLPEATAPSFRLDYLTIPDLARVQRDFEPLVPALREMDLRLTGGAVAVTVEGGFDGKSVNLKSPLVAELKDVTLVRGQGAEQRVLLNRETITTNIAGKVDVGETMGANLSALSIKSSSNLFQVQKSDEPLVVAFGGEAPPTPSGQLKIDADVKRIMDVADAFGGGTGESKLNSGALSGTLAFARADQPATQVNGDFVISNLSVPDAFNNEKVAVTLKAIAPDAMDSVQASIDVVSGFANASITEAKIALKVGQGEATRPASVFEMLNGVQIAADVPDLPKVYALLEALAPTAEVEAQQAAAVIKPGAAEADAPLPPMKLTSGSATVKMNVVREQNATKLNISEVLVQKLALQRGDSKYAFEKDIKLNLAASVDTVEGQAEASPADLIRQIQVTQLAGDLGGIAELSMPQPIVVTDVATSPKAKGQIALNGRIEPATHLVEALQGSPAGSLPYRGRYNVTQTIDTQGDVVSLIGSIVAENFRVMQGDKTAFKEDRIDIGNDLAVDPKKQVATIKKLSVNMTESKALNLGVTGGVSDWDEARTLEKITVAINYDLEKLWKIVQPMLSPDQQQSFKDLKVAGTADRTITVAGAFPADVPLSQAIQKLIVEGGFAVNSFSHSGIDAQNVDLKFKVNKGHLTLEAPPINVNNGKARLAGIDIDLTRPSPSDPQGIMPMLNIPADHKLVTNITLNPVLADAGLGKFVNPLFVNPKQARGLVDVTVIKCENFPLGEAMKLQGPENPGMADIELSITEVVIGNEAVGQFLRWVSDDVGKNDAFTGNIRKGRIQVANGIVTQDITLQLDKHPMRFQGSVRMADQRFMPLNVTIPPSILKQANAAGEDFLKALPEGITLPIGGTTASPQLAWDRAITNMLTEAGKNTLLNELGQTLGGDKKDGKKGAKEGGTEKKPDDPVGGLLDLLNQDGEKEKEKEKGRRRRE